MSAPKPVAVAKAMFDSYAGLDADDLPEGDWSALQVRLYRWQSENFGVSTDEQLALGVAEEAGELAHAILKRSQKIRGMADREAARAAIGDAIADVTIYAMQLATSNRLDFETLVRETAEKVMRRDWRKRPVEAGEDGDDSRKPEGVE